MRLDEQIIKRLKDMSTGPYICIPAIVQEVNKQDFTCTVIPQGGAELSDVRLKAGIENKSDGLVQIPVMGSSVLIVFIGNTDENAFVAKYSEVEEVLFYGGENGGLIKVNELKTQLDKNTALIKEMRQVFTDWTPPPAPDAGSALILAMKARVTSLPLADYSNIENPKVKH